jgi:predicted GNAT family N-acyltransferase
MEKIIKDLKKENQSFIYHISKAEWGGAFLVMEKNGKAFARTYWFNDDNKTIYFDWLSVEESERGNGIATELLNAHIETAKKNNVNSCLYVEKNSWMYDWYSRKGYIETTKHETEINAIWMQINN